MGMGINWKAGCFIYVDGMENVWEILYKEQEHGPLSGPDRRRRIESLMKIRPEKAS